MRTTDDVLAEVTVLLSCLGAHLRNRAVTSTSIYVKFHDPAVGSLRIADHAWGRDYSYRWSLIRGFDGDRHLIDHKGVDRRRYSWEEVDQFVEDIKEFARRRGVHIWEEPLRGGDRP